MEQPLPAKPPPPPPPAKFVFTCPICRNEYGRMSKIQFDALRITLEELDLRCVFDKCEVRLSPKALWQARIVQKRNLNTMPDLRYCPKCSIPGFLGKAGCGEAECTEPQCRFRFCTTCMLAPHSALRCSVAVYELDPEIQKKFFEESMCRQWKANHTKPCPQCKAAIEKNEGCSHMTCRSCKYQFCWICLGPYKPGRIVMGPGANGTVCPCNTP